jgi:hypothetical protein
LRLPLCEKWERNPAQGALHGRREEPEGFKRMCLLTRPPLVLRLQPREVPAEERAEEELADRLRFPKDRVVSS